MVCPEIAAVRIAVTGDVHLEEDKFFLDTKQCVEWLVHDAIA